MTPSQTPILKDKKDCQINDENHEGGHGGAADIKQYAENQALCITYAYQKLMTPDLSLSNVTSSRFFKPC